MDGAIAVAAGGGLRCSSSRKRAMTLYAVGTGSRTRCAKLGCGKSEDDVLDDFLAAGVAAGSADI